MGENNRIEIGDEVLITNTESHRLNLPVGNDPKNCQYKDYIGQPAVVVERYGTGEVDVIIHTIGDLPHVRFNIWAGYVQTTTPHARTIEEVRNLTASYRKHGGEEG